jgi:hypothetical protein
MFTQFWDALGGGAKLIFWMISSVIVPLTIWFAALRSDISLSEKEIKRIDAKIMGADQTTREGFHDIGKRLDVIQQSLGEVRGELRRIK